MRNLSSALFLCIVFIFSGCSSVPSNQRESNQGKDSQGGEPGYDKEEVTSEETVKEPARSPVLAREAEDQQSELAAVRYLLDQAQQALENSETERAIALSDRALKVDRKSPRAYLVLAQAYYLEKRSEQASATARQGLLYTSARSFIGKQLLSLVELN